MVEPCEGPSTVISRAAGRKGESVLEWKGGGQCGGALAELTVAERNQQMALQDRVEGH